MDVLSDDIGMRGEGSYTIKKVRGQEYLYRIHYVKGKQKWEIVGNVKDLDARDPHLIKFRADMLGKQTKELFEKYLSGSIDKAKAKGELMKLLDTIE